MLLVSFRLLFKLEVKAVTSKTPSLKPGVNERSKPMFPAIRSTDSYEQ